MKKGLKIVDGFYVNLENLCSAIFEERTIQLLFVGEELLDICIAGTPYAPGQEVEINEFRRIEREVKTYLEI
ncbi:hypothetical protein CJF42_18960 [Pseudoalteromonas sp. NBT06-2]|uniref:hypothetical protein n=1 Tax=Pseudoalteromonas sp. NBT06-2 TaxID=2025950 RepID=UPI000BA6919A|nr:hypothetical protein [Pseudoalteromonas sp. NBT06-2]PAJ72877.1 hypothetical protein CJF42_18960 [Pseudoalteromonas sp. NBT06-2]